MTTDITELAQMKGQKVEGSYYLAECTDCGKMYPSNKLNGGEPLFSGDYGECYCPHCNADDAAIGDCGDTAAMAWNYQQDSIDALVEALEKAKQKIQAHERAELTWMNALELPDDATRNDILPAIHAEKYTLRAANKRIAELEESHAQVIQSRDHYKRISEEGLKQLAEPRTFIVKLPHQAGLDDPQTAYDAIEECKAAIAAAGVTGIMWEVE